MIIKHSIDGLHMTGRATLLGHLKTDLAEQRDSDSGLAEQRYSGRCLAEQLLG